MLHRCAGLVVLAALLAGPPAAAQAPALRYRPEAIPVGKMLTFEKSNLDGSGAVEVALWVAAADRIELVEALPSGGGGVLVRGTIDWSTGSPRRLEWWFMSGGQRQLFGTLEALAAERSVRVEQFATGRPAETIALPAASWDVYAFNLPVLSLLLGQLAEPETGFSLGVASPSFEPGEPSLKFDGEATFTFAGFEEHAGARCRKYVVSGAGIGEQGAVLWADAQTGTVLELTAERPALPQQKSLRLVWKRTAATGSADWEKLLADRTGSAAARGPVAAETVAPHPCKVPGLDEEVRCATYAVWEDRAAKKGRKIGLNVVILPAKGPERARDPIFLFGGGPGEGITTAAADVAGATELRKRDIVLVDQRGTGRSNPLDCELYGSPVDFRLAAGDGFPLDRVKACKERLEKVADLALYTTDLAMDDVDEVRAWLGYGKINLYGGSYGTRAAQVYLRRHPESVRSAVLVAVAPVDVFLPLTHAYAGQRAIDLLFADCAGQEACRAAFPDLAGDLEKIFARLRAGVSVTVTNTRTGERQEVTPSPGMVAEGIRFAMYGPAANSLPLYLHNAARGDLAPLVQMGIENRLLLDSVLAKGLLFSVTCAEDLPYISEETTVRETRGTFLGDYRIRQQKAVCAVWPRGKVPADVHELVRSDVPVLLLSGERDPVTPPEFGERVASRLANSLHVVVPRGAHGGGECTDELIAQLIDRGTLAGLDPGCVRQAPPTSFMLR